jgi:hypothetical protein
MQRFGWSAMILLLAANIAGCSQDSSQASGQEDPTAAVAGGGVELPQPTKLPNVGAPVQETDFPGCKIDHWPGNNPNPGAGDLACRDHLGQLTSTDCFIPDKGGVWKEGPTPGSRRFQGPPIKVNPDDRCTKTCALQIQANGVLVTKSCQQCPGEDESCPTKTTLLFDGSKWGHLQVDDTVAQE